MSQQKHNRWTGKGKNRCRAEAVKRRKKKPYKCAIFLPSIDCYDLTLALQEGIIDTNTHLILIEGSSNVSDKREASVNQRKWCVKNGFFHVDYHSDRLHKMELSDFLIVGEKIDFAFFDICNSILGELMDWLCYCRDALYFHKDMRVSFTSIMIQRGNPDGIHKFLRELDVEPSLEKVLIYLESLNIIYDLDSKNQLFSLAKKYVEDSKDGQEFFKLFIVHVYNLFMKFSNGKKTKLHYIHGYCDKKNKGGYPMFFVDMDCSFIQKSSNLDIEYARVLSIIKRYKKLVGNDFRVNINGQWFSIKGKNPKMVFAGMEAQASIKTAYLPKNKADKIIESTRLKVKLIIEELALTY